jgi:hypothetical protein
MNSPICHPDMTILLQAILANYRVHPNKNIVLPWI